MLGLLHTYTIWTGKQELLQMLFLLQGRIGVSLPTIGMKLAKDGYAWWKERLSKMADYFDVFRIDHILGFFRIWEIPLDALEGTLGRFNPALPMSRDELRSWGIDFSYERMCKPYIRDYMLHELFGDQAHQVREQFLTEIFPGAYHLNEPFDTQRKIANHFDQAKGQGDPATADRMRLGLLRLAREVIFLEAPLSNGHAFNPNIDLSNTYSFRDLDGELQAKLQELHRQYFLS